MNTEKNHFLSKFTFILFILAVCLNYTATASAKSVHDTLTLNGIALRSQLSREYYIGALYVPTPSRSSPIIVQMNGPKRLEIRVTSDRWTPRRFGQMWNQALSINNSPEALKELTREVVDFTRLIKKPLTTGDTIQVDYDPDKGSIIKINGRKVKYIKNAQFFDALLKCWIGSRPPSSEFKKSILNITPMNKALYERYKSLKPSKQKNKKTPPKNTPKPKPVKPVTPLPIAVATPVVPKVTETKESSAAKAAREAKLAAEEKAREERAAKRAEQRRITQLAEKQRQEEERRQEQARQEALAQEQARLEQERLEQERIAKEKAKIDAEKQAIAQKNAEKHKRLQAKINGLKNDYHARVLRKVYRKVIYPERALDRNQEGAVVLLATINSRGQLKSLSFIDESSYTLLDTAAKNAVKSAQPFGKPAKSILVDGLVELKIPIRFRLP